MARQYRQNRDDKVDLKQTDSSFSENPMELTINQGRHCVVGVQIT